jgi:RNA polymerase sigma factor (TIGR02999 family)
MDDTPNGGTPKDGAPRRGGTEVTRLLMEWRGGDREALDRLIPLVHHELRRLADRQLRRERPDHSLDPTDLVHEAYLRMVDKTHPRWRDRAHFYAVAGQLMRRILVDHARRLRAAKRGGDTVMVPLDEASDGTGEERAADVVALDDALDALAVFDPRKARLVELRFFGGLTIEESAEVLGVSTATVIKDTRLARAWLHAELREDRGEAAP